jgi:hypothetical protein
VSDEESDGETQSTESLPGEQARLRVEAEGKWWKQVMLGLPRMKLRSETLPRIGEQCLVMTEKSGGWGCTARFRANGTSE